MVHDSDQPVPSVLGPCQHRLRHDQAQVQHEAVQRDAAGQKDERGEMVCLLQVENLNGSFDSQIIRFV